MKYEYEAEFECCRSAGKIVGDGIRILKCVLVFSCRVLKQKHVQFNRAAHILNSFTNFVGKRNAVWKMGARVFNLVL